MAALSQKKTTGSKPRSHEYPERLRCPITLVPYVEPVKAPDGRTYSKHAILKWLRTGDGTSPFTRAPMDATQVTPDLQKMAEMAEFEVTSGRASTVKQYIYHVCVDLQAAGNEPNEFVDRSFACAEACGDHLLFEFDHKLNAESSISFTACLCVKMIYDKYFYHVVVYQPKWYNSLTGSKLYNLGVEAPAPVAGGQHPESCQFLTGLTNQIVVLYNMYKERDICRRVVGDAKTSACDNICGQSKHRSLSCCFDCYSMSQQERACTKPTKGAKSKRRRTE